ncbi:MAG: hypothetical protein HOP12_05475 [Candidatus Eisenbacteria bacterium]|uniref:TonB C-terminal domain-containing protein n=1 Tax=Eiseniibacteriota bacterium TaxID=2212470 RepID=A0A849SGF5_UNCEI|nr:hypothetical protein [Candidatus Eisenbacteria bacterium]
MSRDPSNVARGWAALVLCAAIGLGVAEGAAAPARIRIPGTSLRLGDSLLQVSGAIQLRSQPNDRLASGESAFGAELRYYGEPSAATLVFAADVLTRLEVEMHEPSPHSRDYLEDDLRRRGLRRECASATRNRSRCTWFGALRLQVQMESLRVITVASRLDDASDAIGSSEPGGGGGASGSAVAVRDNPFANSLADALADSTPVLPDTLSLNEENPEGYTPPKLVKTIFARIPDDLRTSVERGSVGVLALVGLDGKVIYAEPLYGPEPLYPTVLTALKSYQFERYKTKAGPTRFWVRLSVWPS